MNEFPRELVDRWAARRRPFDALEARVVRGALAGDVPRPAAEAVRYALSFARLTQVRNAEGVDIDVAGINHLHALNVLETVQQRLDDGGLPRLMGALDELILRTDRARAALLDHLPLDRASLEEEITTKRLAVVSGGGGGAGYVYPGVYEALERNGLTPDLMVGTSIGALLSMFRARLRRYDPAPMIAAARALAWGRVFRVLETEARYGLPATLRLYLRSALGNLFQHPDGQPLRLNDLGIPLYVIATGITVDALKHDVDYYEHFLDQEVRRGRGWSVRSLMKTLYILREFLSRQEALRMVVLGRTEGTEQFDVLDAAGFSAAIPGVIHYDVLRDDPHMTRILDALYGKWGISRLGEGGMTSNVPARVAWESVVGGNVGRRNAFVLALDCFSPSRRRLPWMPLQQLVRSSNVDADRAFADLYLPFERTPSPVNLVPSLRDLFTAMRWGRQELEPHLPFLNAMMRPLPVLRAPQAV